MLRQNHFVLTALAGATLCAARVRAQGWSALYDYTAQIGNPMTCLEGSTLAHAGLVPQGPHAGKVVFWMRYQTTAPDPCNPTVTAEFYFFDPALPNNLIRFPQNLSSNVFCGGMSWDANGDLVIAGGRRQSPTSPDLIYRLHPENLGNVNPGPGGYPVMRGILGTVPLETVTNTMCQGRYYPSVIPLLRTPLAFASCPTISGGAHLICGGPAHANNEGTSAWDVLSTGTNICSLDVIASPCSGEIYTLARPNLPPKFDSYPRAFQLSNREVFVAFDIHTVDTPPPPSPGGMSWVIKPNYGAGSWELWPGPLHGPTCGADVGEVHDHGTAILMHTLARKDRVLVFGGETNPCGATLCDPLETTSVSKHVWEFAPGSPSAPGGPVVSGAWYPKADMHTERKVFNAVILPTGVVALVGGLDDCGLPVFNAELYDPADGPTSVGVSTLLPAPANRPREYHSTAVLMPDGRVLVAGGQNAEPPCPTCPPFPPSLYNLEFFLPRYVTNPVFPRPLITGTSGTLLALNDLGSATQTFDVDVTVQAANNIDRVVLLRPAAVTHHFDDDQRYIELPFTSTGSGTARTLHVTCPEDNLAPPGWYTLWVVEANAGGQRVPSESRFVRFQ